MVFIPNFNDTIGLYNSTGFDPRPSDSRYSRSNNEGEDGNRNNGFLVAIEVIFSLLVLFILLFCLFSGLRKKKRLRREREEIIETAIERQQEQCIQQMQCHSNTTMTTLIQCPPPCYSPPDPTTQLSSATVNRLDRLLLENQIPLSLSNRALPKYSEQ
ncbi:hypothetical protein BDF21DRAFT_467334 [Thamnidium elegans]|nr:hypothetical protein BDF21DRAFT_467334 [Thamnidium elegans]